MSNITIYHNPACGTSRNTLEMIRNSGTEPTIIYYLETPYRDYHDPAGAVCDAYRAGASSLFHIVMRY